MNGQENAENGLNSVEVFGRLVKGFISGQYTKMSIVFEKPLILTEDEYLNIMGPMDASGGTADIDVFMYITDVERNTSNGMCKMLIKVLEIGLETEDGFDADRLYKVTEVRGRTYEKATNCKDNGE